MTRGYSVKTTFMPISTKSKNVKISHTNKQDLLDEGTGKSKGGGKPKSSSRKTNRSKKQESVKTPGSTQNVTPTVMNNVTDLHNNIIKHYRLAGDNNKLTTDDIFRLLDLYFYKEFYKYRHLHDSYDKFVDDTIPRFFTDLEHVFAESITEERYIKHKFVFENVRAESPKLSNNIDPMFPAD